MMSADDQGPRIIIAGAPASGKGTQCSMIKERYGVVHLSTGTAVAAPASMIRRLLRTLFLC